MPVVSRRAALKGASCGFGYLALSAMAAEAAAKELKLAAPNPLAVKPPMFPAKAKRVIFMSMRGGPSHLDTFDYKPALEKDAGKSVSGNGTPGDRIRGNLLASPFKFVKSGESGLPISDVFPHLAKHADDLCLINSVCTDVPNHPQSFLMMHTGEFRFTRPSLGAWVLYGLGTENQNLPGFVTITPPADLGGAQNYGNAFLAAAYQATRIGELGDNVAAAKIGNLTPATTSDAQRRQIDLIQAMNRDLLDRGGKDQAVEGLIDSYELGFRMQKALPDVLDLSKETAKTLEMYGISGKAAGGNGKNNKPAQAAGGTDNFGRQCLMARRLVEAGVRFVEIAHGNWDTHGGLKNRVAQLSGQIDLPIAGLLQDLKQRGLLKDTLVVWGGEFGRTPTGQGADGRNHNSAGFSMWMAGGGVKGGTRYGETDEHGGKAVKDKMHHHDIHATMLHLLGLDHQKLTFRYGGRDYSLTDIHGRVAKDMMA
ncbi:MAG: DUF1501 domain-containing protein [Planctomycetes bacterium]|nr:DUF1501 domain-containing protein [Planctomycetota bacterium]